MAYGKEAARHGCNHNRARGVHFEQRDARIVPRNDWETGTGIAGWAIGIAFGLMLFIGIWMGW